MQNLSPAYLNNQFETIFKSRKTDNKKSWKIYSSYFLSIFYNFIYHSNRAYITIGPDYCNDYKFTDFDQTLSSKDATSILKEMVRMINYEFHEILTIKMETYGTKNVFYIYFSYIPV